MPFYDEVELEDLTFHPELLLYTYPCPCGDQFEICLDDMRDGEEVAVCPSCSLTIRVIFDQVSFFFFLSFFLSFFLHSPGRHISRRTSVGGEGGNEISVSNIECHLNGMRLTGTVFPLG